MKKMEGRREGGRRGGWREGGREREVRLLSSVYGENAVAEFMNGGQGWIANSVCFEARATTNTSREGKEGGRA